MTDRTRRLMATTSLLAFLAAGAAACEASVDDDGADLQVDEVDG